METLLKARELWGPIGDSEVKPQGDAIALLAYTKRENKALTMEILLHSFQPCLFLLMMMHGASTLEHQCTFHTNGNGNGSRILKKSHL